MKEQFTIRAALVYLVALAAAWILTEVVWGSTGGLLGGLSIVRNPEYPQKFTSFLKDKGVNPDASESEVRKMYQNLSEEDQQELMRMIKEVMADVNWFFVTFLVSAAVFGFVGIVGGFITRAWILAGAVPALSFLTNNPVIRYQKASDLSIFQKVIVVVLAQFAVCYLLAYCGARLGLKWKQKREAANQRMQRADGR